jgi:hypothetical protein
VARLADLHQRESVFEAGRTVVAVATLLDMLPTPSTDGVSEVYRWLKNILGYTVVQQAESSLQHWVDASVLTPIHPKGGGQGAAQGDLEVGTTSSRDKGFSPRPVAPTRRSVEATCAPMAPPRARQRVVPMTHTKPASRGRDNRKAHSLSPEGSGPKAFGSAVRDARFPSRFCVPGNIVKYDVKTNPSIWLEDYRLACRVGGVNDDLFIIKFLPLYLVDSSRA